MKKTIFETHFNHKPGIERVQALAHISRSMLCCHSNETRAATANPPNTAQLGDTPYHSPKLHPGPCSSVGMRRGTDTQTNTQTAVTNTHFASATPHVKCNSTMFHCITSDITLNATAESENHGKGERHSDVLKRVHAAKRLGTVEIA